MLYFPKSRTAFWLGVVKISEQIGHNNIITIQVQHMGYPDMALWEWVFALNILNKDWLKATQFLRKIPMRIIWVLPKIGKGKINKS